MCLVCINWTKFLVQVSRTSFLDGELGSSVMGLTEDMAASITSTMVLSRLDYSNSLLFGCLVFNIAKLKCLQDTAALIVLNTQRLSPSQHLLQHLHLLYVFISISSIK